MPMQLLRLRGRKICDRVLRHGSVWKGKTMVVRFLSGAPKHPAVNPETKAVYIGILASARLDKSAVVRNRMRRRCREAFRLVLKDGGDFSTVQLLIAPRSSSLMSPFEDIKRDVSSFLSQLTHAGR